MITLARIELRKLTTTPALYVSAGIVALFTVLSVAAGILLAGQQGTPRWGRSPTSPRPCRSPR
jgi:hypothetical protein